MFDKNNSIKVSERVFDLLYDEIQVVNEYGCESSDYNYKLNSYLSTFNNCREQGFYLTIWDGNYENENRVKDDLYIWVYESRNSDDIVVVFDKESTCNGMFSNEAWNNRFHFKCRQEHEVVEFIIAKICDFFKII